MTLKPNIAQIRAFWLALNPTDNVHEIRIIDPKEPEFGKPTFCGKQSGYYNNVERVQDRLHTITGDQCDAGLHDTQSGPNGPACTLEQPA